MFDILVRAFCFIGIIVLGFVLKKTGFLKQEDFKLLSKICLNITLTATIVVSFSGKTLANSMLLLVFFAWGFGALLLVSSNLAAKIAGKNRSERAFSMLNSSGCNLGNFALPFAQSFCGPVGVMAISLFDVGNSFICLGGAASIARVYQDKEQKFSLKPILKLLSKSVPLMTYIVCVILCMLKINLPSPVIEYAQIISNANAFLCMFMIGVGFNLSGDKSQLLDIVRILGLRFALGITCALLSYFCLPFPVEWRQALVIVFLAPIASAAPAFTSSELKGDYGLASAINSISILISIGLITGALVFMLG